MSEPRGPFRGGLVHVASEKCSTCIFRPGNLMQLRRGRVAEMKRGADEQGTAITCHDTMDSDHQAVCRGYYDRHKSSTLTIAQAMQIIVFEG